MGCFSRTVRLDTSLTIFASRLRVVPSVILCHNLLNLLIEETLASFCALSIRLLDAIKGMIDLCTCRLERRSKSINAIFGLLLDATIVTVHSLQRQLAR